MDKAHILKHLTSLYWQRWMFVCLILTAPLALHAQCPPRTTQGTDFWVMFLSNIDPENSLSLIAASEYDNTVIQVYNHNTNWDTSITLVNGGVVEIPISHANGHSDNQGTTITGGLHITTSLPISLYASNFRMSSYDISTILPTTALGTSYITQTCTEFPEEEIGFVATEDSTEVTVQLRQPNETRNITLQRGHSHQIRRSNLSGTTITSNSKPIAVFQGHRCTPVGDCNACDHLYEQVLPELLWGKLFMLIPTIGRTNGDLVKVTAWEDSCTLTLDGEILTTLAAKESYAFTLPSDSAKLLRSSKPVLACLYLKGFECSIDSIGDPSSVIIPPVEQGLQRVTFAATNTTTTTQHYTNIAVRSDDVPYMELDNHSIDSAFTATLGGYSYAQLAVSPGLHTLSNANGPFVSHFYGLGIAESYAYIAGMATIDLSYRILCEDDQTSGMAVLHTFCQGDTGHFRVTHPEKEVRADWLVDSQIVAYDTNTLNYQFTTPGRHIVSAVYDACDTLFSYVLIHPAYDILTIDSFCFNTTYQWQGLVFDSMGLYSRTYSSVLGCDSTLWLNLVVIPRPQVTINQHIDCHNGTNTLSIDLAEATGSPVLWSSTPTDTLLSGHEEDVSVTVMPYTDPTTYHLAVDYRCPFVEDIPLSPVVWPQADWEIQPTLLTHEHPWFDAYDLTPSVDSRRWFVDGRQLGTTLPHLQYTAPHDADSLLIMLIVEKGSCTDTLRHTLSYNHADIWSPNAFTPSGETDNRFIVIINEGKAEDLYIYTRKGQLMAHFDDPIPQWDGTHEGKPCPQGTYVYLLRYHLDRQTSRTLTLTGTVTLIR